MQVDNVEILTVEEFLEILLLILKIPFFLILSIKLNFTLKQAINSQGAVNV